MFGARSRLRAAVLLLGGAVVVHELRYMLAPTHASHGLAGRHAYLLVAVPMVGVLLSFLLAQLLVVMGGGRPGPDGGRSHFPRPVRSRPALWLTATAALIALFAVQETLETLLSGGNAAALALYGLAPGAGPTLAAAGGWLVLPLAAGLGALVTLALGAAEEPLGPVRVRRVSFYSDALPELLTSLRSVVLVSGDVLALHLAGRAPPSTSVR